MPGYRITRQTVTGSAWSEIVAPNAIDGFAFYAEGNHDIKIRTDVNDPETEKTLSSGQVEVLFPSQSGTMKWWRFRQGQPVCFIRLVEPESSSVVVVTWTGIEG